MEGRKVLSGAGAHWEKISGQRKNKKERQEKWRPHSAFCPLDSLKIWLHYCPGRKRVWLVSNIAQLHISSFLLWLLASSFFPFLWSRECLEHCFSLFKLVHQKLRTWHTFFCCPQRLLLLKSNWVVLPTGQSHCRSAKKAQLETENVNHPHNFSWVGEMVTRVTGWIRASKGGCWLRNWDVIYRGGYEHHGSQSLNPLHTATSRYHEFSFSASNCKPFSFLW